MSDPMPRENVHGGHLAALADFSGRMVLDAWEAALEDPHDPVRVEALAVALELLRDVLPADPPESYDPRPYIAAQEWTYAKTMPTNPHFYVVLRASNDWREHLRFLLWIRVWGFVEKFKGAKYLYRVVDEWRYWAMGPNDTIINRRKEPTE